MDDKYLTDNGMVLVQRNPDKAVDLSGGRWHGWLFWHHPDGNWVSERKLEPWEIMQAEDQRDEGHVIDASLEADDGGEGCGRVAGRVLVKPLREQVAEAIAVSMDLPTTFYHGCLASADAAIKAVREATRCGNCRHWTQYPARPDLGACDPRGGWTWERSDGCNKWEE